MKVIPGDAEDDLMNAMLRMGFAALLPLSVFGQALTGRVVDGSAQPVSGVKVTLAKSGGADTTGADGRFSLPLPGVGLLGRPSAPAPRLDGAFLRLHLASTSPVTVSLHTVSGRLAAVLFDGRLPTGAQTVSLGVWRRDLGPGLFVLSVRSGGLSWYARISGATPESGNAVILRERGAFLAKAAGTPDADTLLLTKSGWYGRQAGVPALSPQDLGDLVLRKDVIRTGNATQDQYNQIIVESVDRRIQDSTTYLILKAMIVIESSFNAKAISMYDVTLPCGTHSYGLIQVTPGCIRGYATLPSTTPVTATISGGLSGNPAKLTYFDPADQASGNTIVKENNIVINLVSNPQNPHWPTSGFNPAYNLDYGAKTLGELIAEMKRKFPSCTRANYVSMALAGYNQGSGTVTGCTAYSAGGVAYAGKVIEQYRRFAQAAGVPAVY